MSEEEFSWGAKHGVAAYMIYTTKYKKKLQKIVAISWK